MPASVYPIETHQDGEVTIHIQYLNRRTPAHRTADNLRAILTPLEMALPLLPTGVKESHPPAGFQVTAMRSVTLGTVTQPTFNRLAFHGGECSSW